MYVYIYLCLSIHTHTYTYIHMNYVYIYIYSHLDIVILDEISNNGASQEISMLSAQEISASIVQATWSSVICFFSFAT